MTGIATGLCDNMCNGMYESFCNGLCNNPVHSAARFESLMLQRGFEVVIPGTLLPNSQEGFLKNHMGLCKYLIAVNRWDSPGAFIIEAVCMCAYVHASMRMCVSVQARCQHMQAHVCTHAFAEFTFVCMFGSVHRQQWAFWCSPIRIAVT